MKNIQIQINLYVVIICSTIGVLLLYDILMMMKVPPLLPKTSLTISAID